MIRVDHLTLPPGLDAIARRIGPGELHVVLSDTLDPSRQRAAVRTAVRAARRHAWEFGFLPLPLAAAPAMRGAVRHAFRFLRAHGAVSAVTGSLAAGAVAATAAVFIVAVPPHGHPVAVAPNAPGYSRSSGRAHPAAGTQPGAPAHGQRGDTGPRVITVGTQKTSTPHPGPQPSPTTSSSSSPARTPPPTTSSSPPSQPQPTPTATSSPPSGSGGTCVIILGLKVCL
jgi:hypothetical protein